MLKITDLSSDRSFTISRRESSTFIIAEIGQNHQGDINLAKKLIEKAKECGADCVKFQKSCLEEKFNKAALERRYGSPHSFGETYGAHKKFLEFTNEQFIDLQNHAKKVGILFTASAMDLKSLNFLEAIEVPFIKIGSGDANNPVLIKAAAEKHLPLIISTGMQDFEAVRDIYNTVKKYHDNFALMHCISAYPTPVNQINLNVIQLYKQKFPDIVIGYSGHELGTHISESAVVLGAKIIERHFTLDKTLKGSDHSCSLKPQEFQNMVKNIRDIEMALGEPIKKMQESERVCYEKLGKTIVAARMLKAGSVIEEDDLKIKVAEPKGIDGKFYKTLIGAAISQDVNEDESILEEFIIKQ